MAMQAQHLTYFTAVARTGHFTRAADEVGVAQPTLSKQVRVLEAELGTPLFDRAPSGATLTQAGEVLLPYATRILTDLDEARRQVQELAGLRRGRLRIGATPSLTTGLLAEVLGAFRRAHPALDLQVQESGSRDLVALLRAGAVDLALLIAPDRQDEAGLVTTVLLREDLVVVAATSGPDLPEELPVRALAGWPLVLPRQGYDLREMTLSALRAAGVDPVVAVEGGELDAVLRFAEAGVGVAVVPVTALAGRTRLKVARLVEPRLCRTVGIAHRQGIALPPAAAAFRRVLIDHLAALPRTELAAGVDLVGPSHP